MPPPRPGPRGPPRGLRTVPPSGRRACPSPWSVPSSSRPPRRPRGNHASIRRLTPPAAGCKTPGPELSFFDTLPDRRHPLTPEASLRPLPISVPFGEGGDLPALVLESPSPVCFLALAHGAGAGMEHPFMDALARRLAGEGVSTLRFQFPYMAAGSRRPDRRPRLVAAWEAAMAVARERAGGLPLLAGGKSMGGRIASHAAAEGLMEGVRGLVFVGFPLHPARKPGTARAAHLGDVRLPMLFLQGTRDALADLSLLRPVVEDLGPRATLHVVDGADHGFHVLKRSGRTDEGVLDELAATAGRWAAEVARRR